MAKPKKQLTGKFNGISVRLDLDDIRDLEELADDANLKRSVYIRKLLKDHLRAHSFRR